MESGKVTTHKSTSIDIADLVGLHFECGNCGTTVVVPIRTVDNRPIEQCPNCKRGWGVANHKSATKTADYIRAVVDSLRALQQRMEDTDSLGFSLTLEIDTEPKIPEMMRGKLNATMEA